MKPLLFLTAVFGLFLCGCQLAQPFAATIRGADRANVIFVLGDDHRYDALGFMGHPFLKTPHMDRMAKEGVHFASAYITTSLCSPARASILTGLYAHNHGVVDNYHPVNPSLRFFPEYMQKAGYETAFIGKWHMGDDDRPQRGFDHWAAFRGQGTYYPDGHGTSRVVPQNHYDGFNINGKKRVPQKGYITDELTDYSIDWLKNRKAKQKPFFMYISHKAIHSDFVPRDKDRGMYKNAKWSPPKSFPDTPANRLGRPAWVINQRNSRHGVDYGYNLQKFDLEYYYKRYCEAIVPLDDHIGDLMAYLEKSGELDNTLLVYMGDNGFQFGEHGLIDKRTAYEHSIRVPLLMRYPKRLKAGTKIKQVVSNIDIGPTILEIAGVPTPEHMDGASFWKIAKGQNIPWRSALLYEYFWEWNYPQTPTIYAAVGQRFKYIRSHGLWATDELYDVQADPDELHNLVRDPAHAKTAATMKQQLFTLLKESNGMKIPFNADRGRQFYNRHPDRAKPGAFPKWYYDKMVPVKKGS